MHSAYGAPPLHDSQLVGSSLMGMADDHVIDIVWAVALVVPVRLGLNMRALLMT